ncbi:MAG: hypothetical protein KAR57_02570 [Bacteroidales bacterium]|nr:hypothetical protein [Bacteroidales bacterium]
MEKNKVTEKQLEFLNRIKDLIPSNTSIVYELSELLDLSTDSMYRRLRGETPLTFDEVVILCNHFKISFDSFINLESGNVTFNYTLMEEGENSFKKYLTSIRDDLKIIKAAKQHLITYACEDIPIFHNINSPKIASFKMLYWMKAILNLPSLEDIKYDSSLVSEDLIDLGQEIYNLYSSIPSVEIWTDTTLTSTVKQIEFFWASGVFKSNKDAIEVYESLYNSIKKIEKQAEAGTKILESNNPDENVDNYSFYVSEIELTNNCVLVNLGNVKAVYIGHLSFNTMNTSNATYCKETEKWLNNIIRKSTLISKVAEKTRYQFFNGMYNYLDDVIEKIKNTE